MQRRIIAAAFVMAAFLGGRAAQAEDFYFTFSGSAYDADNGLSSNGVVSGIIAGLIDNTTSTPTFIYTRAIEGSDAGTQVFLAPQSQADLVGADFIGGFTVTNGAITGAHFSALPSNFDEDPVDALMFDDLVDGGNRAILRPIFVTNLGGFAGVTYRPLIDAAPEPSNWILLLSGVGMIGAVLRRRHLTAVAA